MPLKVGNWCLQDLPSPGTTPIIRVALTTSNCHPPLSVTSMGEQYACLSPNADQTRLPEARSSSTIDFPFDPPGSTITVSSTTSSAAAMPQSRFRASLSFRMLVCRITFPRRRQCRAIHRSRQARRRARQTRSASPSDRRHPSIPELGGPRWSTTRDRLDVIRSDDFLGATLLNRECAAPGDDKRRVAATHRLFPVSARWPANRQEPALPRNFRRASVHGNRSVGRASRRDRRRFLDGSWNGRLCWRDRCRCRCRFGHRRRRRSLCAARWASR